MTMTQVATAPDAGVTRLLLIGEDNPLSLEPKFALYCYPPGCAGYRLRRILGLPQHQYLGLPRVNLCRGTWSTRQAREQARMMTSDPSAAHRILVMLGRKVADAFGYEREFFTTAIHPRTATWETPITLVSLPHPSGRNTASWSGAAVQRAQQLLTALIPEVPWGTAS